MNWENIGIAKRITGSDTTVVANEAAILLSIHVGYKTDSAIQVYDHATAASGQIASIAANELGTQTFNAICANGIVVKTNHSNEDITVVYRKTH